VQVDFNLPAAKEAQALMSEIVEKEEREKVVNKVVDRLTENSIDNQ
jgi:hypothetical protein